MTNIIKLRFLKSGAPRGREYTYFTPVEVQVGDVVEMETVRGTAVGMVSQIYVPESEIAAFRDKAKSIIGKAVPKEEQAETGEVSEHAPDF